MFVKAGTIPLHGIRVPFLLLIVLLLSQGCEFDNLADEREFVTGPTNIHAAVGNGGLSTAFSSRGEITVLRWPSPSYYDQLNYMTAILTPGAIKKPRMGAEENRGILTGLFYTRNGQKGVTWLRDTDWEINQTYLTESSNVVLTEYWNEELSLKVRSLSFVLPDRDVLSLIFEVTRLEGSAVEQASLLFFENLSPCLDKISLLFAVTDWLLDARNDFAALYDNRKDVLVHFRPTRGKDLLSGFDPLLSEPPQNMEEGVNSLIDNLGVEFGPGIYIAVGSPRASQAHQVGFDASMKCDQPRQWSYIAQDAYRDASDGLLSGSPIAACQANAALQWDLDLSTGSDEVPIYMAFSSSWEGEDGALALLEAVREEPAKNHLELTESWWKAWIARAKMPETEDPHLLKVGKRALISVKTATDRNTGAIVASIATQPPYSLDWPRDGAFINYALDRAGFHEMVTKHNLFYAEVQRKEPLLDLRGGTIAPAGTYATNYYADGMEGWPIAFEIDNAGLAAWTMAEHVRFLEGAERTSYLREIWPAIRLTVTELAECRDEENGLQCHANEGDSIDLTQGLIGAVAVYTALKSALELGDEAGEDKGLLEMWRSRRDELKTSLLSQFWNDEGYFETGFPYPRGFVSWVIWPSRLLPYDDPRMESHARHMFDFIEPHLRKETEYGLYDAEAVSALTHIWRTDTEGKEKIRWALDVLAREVQTRGTHHYSEVYTVESFAEGEVFLPRTGIPHVWSASLVYLASVEATEGEAEGGGADGAGNSTSGCSCSTGANASPPWTPEATVNGLLYLMPLLFLYYQKRRRDRIFYDPCREL